MVLRELGSPVPAYTTFVSLGAMASTPMAMTLLSSNTGRHVVPLFVLFQMPPPAASHRGRQSSMHFGGVAAAMALTIASICAALYPCACNASRTESHDGTAVTGALMVTV